MVVSIKGVVRVGNKILLCMNHRDEWELPGGRPELGEQPRQACAREIIEESGIAVDVAQHPVLVQNFEVIPGQWVLIIAYACTSKGSTALTPSDEHTAISLFTKEEALTLERLPQVYKDAIMATTP